MMDFDLSDDQKVLREKIISFAEKELNEGVPERDREQVFPRKLWDKCGKMGLQGLPIPEKYGGSGLDPLTTAVAMEALGYGCHDSGLVFSIGAHLFACVIPVWKFGSEEQKKRYLPGMGDGSLIATNAMTESGSGSDTFSLRTTAVKEGEGFRINGTKTFCSNSPVADVALTFALTDPEKRYYGGITAFLIDKGTPGFSSHQKFEKMGLRSSPIGELVFEDVFVPESAVLGEIGSGSNIFIQAMEWERICIFAGHVGTMERILEKSIEYARTRKQFGQAIGKFQAVSHKIADMKVQVEAARLLVQKAAWALDIKKYVSLDASIAKLFVSESLVKTAMDTIQIFGGYGFMTEYEMERALRDAVGSTIYSGTSEIHRNIIAKWLGL